MKATLVIVENDRDHRQAKALVEKLMDSTDPSDQARLIAQARLIDAYEQSRWPRRASCAVKISCQGGNCSLTHFEMKTVLVRPLARVAVVASDMPVLMA
jgi:antitoxin component HigA of HigAB toxin-antitoxin module